MTHLHPTKLSELPNLPRDPVKHAEVASVSVCKDAFSFPVAQDPNDPNVGSVVWPCTKFLLDGLVASPSVCGAFLGKPADSVSDLGPRPDLLRGVRLLEVGAGTGVAGMAAALLGAKQVTLTEHAPALGFLQHNATLYKDFDDQRRRDASAKADAKASDQASQPLPIDVAELDWNKPNESSVNLGAYDVMLLSECLFDTAQITDSPVLRLIVFFLRTGKREGAMGAPRVILAFEERDEDIETAFFDQAKAAHVQVKKLVWSQPVKPSEGNTRKEPVHYVIYELTA